MKFSIVTCTYNSEKYVQKNIDSVKNQTCQDFEHIFIDGFSTDGTIKIIEKYQKEFPEKVKIFQFEPKGISDAMNKGIENATGEYINHLHSDDIFFNSNILEKIYNFIQKNNSPDWVYGKANFIDESKNLKKIIPHRRIYHKARFWLLLLTDYIPHQAVFLKKKIFEKYRMFDIQYKNHMDYEMWLRLSKKKVSSVFIDEIICNFSLRDDSQSSIGRQNDEYKKIFTKYIRNKALLSLLNFIAVLNKKRNFF